MEDVTMPLFEVVDLNAAPLAPIGILLEGA